MRILVIVAGILSLIIFLYFISEAMYGYKENSDVFRTQVKFQYENATGLTPNH